MQLTDLLFDLDFSYIINDDNTLSLIDLQGVNLGSIEKEKFDVNENLARTLIDRLEIYINDYFISGYKETLEKDYCETITSEEYSLILEKMKKYPESFETCIELMECIINPDLLDISSILDDLEVTEKCPRCGGRLRKSPLPDYAYYCQHCEEDFYSFEVMGVIKCTNELIT